MARIGLRRASGIAAAILVTLTVAAAFIWRDDILRNALDPKEPFQIYAPPPPPDYAQPASWALAPGKGASALPVDVFFIHPTTFNGGAHWNGPIDDPASARQLQQVMLPNYAGPFLSVGRINAPRYRQASLYSYLTLRDDAREARRFAYGDVQRAFQAYLQRYNNGRPFIVVGVEQGGFLGDRLLREVISRDPALVRRMAAAYLIRTVVAADDYGPGAAVPACRSQAQARCVVAFAVAPETGGERARELLGRSLLWGKGPELENLRGRRALCVNPLLGAQSEAPAPDMLNLGASNATDVEWGVRPAFLPRQVSARCVDGVLRVSRPKSQSLRPSGTWADRLKAPAYNLFFADLEADALQRSAVLLGRPYVRGDLPPIGGSIVVGRAPIHRID